MIQRKRNFSFLAVAICLGARLHEVAAFVPISRYFQPAISSRNIHIQLFMAKGKRKKKSGGVASAGIRGFGGATTTGSKNNQNLDKSKETRAFYQYMEQYGAGDNLKRVAMGYIPIKDGDSVTMLRGVNALRDIAKGEVLIRIPYELAINLGPEGDNPTVPALKLLNDYCQTMGQTSSASNSDRAPYFEMLPPFRGDDCMGSTDFFSDDALEALQAPLVVEETLKRREKVKAAFQRDIGDEFPRWIDGEPVTVEHLQWAVWLVTSRVLTVQGDAGQSYRLLIPFLDMCNHDRNSPHVLTGRAVPGGELKVVAGAPIKAGDPVNICYGGGVAGNDRFLQDYGFLDWVEEAYDTVALQILGKRRILEGGNAGRTMALVDRENALAKLEESSIEDDESHLEREKDPAKREALRYRLGVKRALVRKSPEQRERPKQEQPTEIS